MCFHVHVYMIVCNSGIEQWACTCILCGFSYNVFFFRHREEVDLREERVRKVAGEVVALQDLISQLRRQITHTQERLPQLEEAKKTAVAGTYIVYMYNVHMQVHGVHTSRL